MFESATSFLNPVLHPLVEIHPFFAIAIVSILIAIFNSYVYKWLTDQHLMKALKTDMKKMQEEMRKYKDNTSKMMEIQSKLMSKNLEYMKQSFKSTLVTMIPIFIIFSWMTAHLAYDPIPADTQFSVHAQMSDKLAGIVALSAAPKGITFVTPAEQTIDSSDQNVTWLLRGAEGKYVLTYKYGNATVSQPLLVTKSLDYEAPVAKHTGGLFVSTKIGNADKVVLDLGFYEAGYLMTYFICAIVFSLTIRKLLGLY